MCEYMDPDYERHLNRFVDRYSNFAHQIQSLSRRIEMKMMGAFRISEAFTRRIESMGMVQEGLLHMRRTGWGEAYLNHPIGVNAAWDVLDDLMMTDSRGVFSGTISQSHAIPVAVLCDSLDGAPPNVQEFRPDVSVVLLFVDDDGEPSEYRVWSFDQPFHDEHETDARALGASWENPFLWILDKETILRIHSYSMEIAALKNL